MTPFNDPVALQQHFEKSHSDESNGTGPPPSENQGSVSRTKHLLAVTNAFTMKFKANHLQMCISSLRVHLRVFFVRVSSVRNAMLPSLVRSSYSDILKMHTALRNRADFCHSSAPHPIVYIKVLTLQPVTIACCRDSVNRQYPF